MENVFKYPDTNSSRAGIEMLNERFRGLKIAIIGLGGTGSYILDLVSKTPVAEIHIFDGDIYHLHNAYRAPGAIDGEFLDAAVDLKKVDYYFGVYSKMHGGIKVHPRYVTAEDLAGFKIFDFVFISVDKNQTRSMITKGLLEYGVSFIDTGLGVKRVGDSLVGTIRATVGTKEKNDHLGDWIGSEEFAENEYANNIQIADLNCLNATLAVMRWKKEIGFYQSLKQEHNMLYFINTNRLLNEDYPS